MVEATADTTPDAVDLAQLARELDRARMKQIGSYHFAMVTGALTMWGAAVAWFQVTDWAGTSFLAMS